VVRLIGLTQPVPGLEVATSADLVAYMARVSNPKNQGNTKTAKKLLKSLVRDAHWSPLEMVNIVIEIETTRDISRQIVRHRSFSYQEFSQRYAVVDNLPILREARLQDTKNRQNSVDVQDSNLSESWNMHQAEVYNLAKEKYNWAIEKGIAKEQARVVLPEGNTYTIMYMNGTLRSWVHYCLLRMSNGTQKEHSKIAAECWDIIKEHFPNIAEIAEELESSNKFKIAIFNFMEQYMPDTLHKIKLDFQRFL
jgi:thymidylate synthase (FAD)